MASLHDISESGSPGRQRTIDSTTCDVQKGEQEYIWHNYKTKFKHVVSLVDYCLDILHSERELKIQFPAERIIHIQGDSEKSAGK